ASAPPALYRATQARTGRSDGNAGPAAWAAVRPRRARRTAVSRRATFARGSARIRPARSSAVRCGSTCLAASYRATAILLGLAPPAFIPSAAHDCPEMRARVMAPVQRLALWRNPGEQLNGKDDDGPLNHGTICAGIIAGRPTAEKPLVTGVAPRARLMVLNGMGYLKAYEYALAHGADVLSMSYTWVNMELGHYRDVFRAAAEHVTAGGV